MNYEHVSALLSAILEDPEKLNTMAANMAAQWGPDESPGWEYRLRFPEESSDAE